MDYLGQEMSRSLDLVQCMQPTCLIQDLNITRTGCKYPTPPCEFRWLRRGQSLRPMPICNFCRYADPADGIRLLFALPAVKSQ